MAYTQERGQIVVNDTMKFTYYVRLNADGQMENLNGLGIFVGPWPYQIIWRNLYKKRIQETPNLSTDADRSTATY